MIKKKKLTREEKIVEKRQELAKAGAVAAIWTRVSSEDQFKHNCSIETQRRSCQEYCERHGIKVKREFGGTNESAKVVGENFMNMISEIGNDPEINCVVVFDFDRFSRNSHDGIVYKTLMKKRGIRVLSVNQPIDPNNILGEQIENILIIIADIDNAMRRHKCHDGMVACINRGEWYSKPPLGYDSRKVDRKHIITVNEKGKILRLAFDWVAKEPKISQSEVIRRLQVRGLEITKQRLSECLRNPFYCGILEHKYLDKPIQGVQEPLVSKSLFNRVQDVLNGNTNGYQQNEVTPRFPLKMSIFCAKDHHALTGYTVKAKNKDYYKCGVKGCKTNVSAKEAHLKYAEILNTLSIPEELYPLLEIVARRKFAEKEGQNEVSRAQIEKNIKTIETKLKNAKMRYVTEGNISESDYNEVKEELVHRLTDNKAELAKLNSFHSNLADYTSTVLKFASGIGSEWGKGDFMVCQQIQSLVFPDGILWDGENRSYRTEGMNPFFSKIALLHASIGGERTQKKDKSCDLSCLVAGGGLEPPTSGL